MRDDHSIASGGLAQHRPQAWVSCTRPEHGWANDAHAANAGLLSASSRTTFWPRGAGPAFAMPWLVPSSGQTPRRRHPVVIAVEYFDMTCRDEPPCGELCCAIHVAATLLLVREQCVI